MTSGFTEEKVDKLADLLLIGLSDEERKMVFDEFDIIDSDISKITEIENLSEIKPMTHTLDDFVYELREDEAEESISIEDALRNCDNVDGREVEVVKVVG